MTEHESHIITNFVYDSEVNAIVFRDNTTEVVGQMPVRYASVLREHLNKLHKEGIL